MEVIQIGNIFPTKTRDNPNQGRVYDCNGLCPTITNMQGGGRQPMIIEDKSIVRQVGRNPENPTSRQVGLPTEQRLEPNSEGICNTLTTVQKDNLVLEKHICALDEQNMNLRHETFGTLTTDGSSPKHNNRVMETVRIKQANKQGYIDCEVGGVADFSYPSSTTRRGRVQDRGNTCLAITVEGAEQICRVESQYRIRKLTPKECWRLMAFTDEDFHKAEAVNSNTQLYKQAGNSIVVTVLEAIFRQMCIQDIPTWNEEKGA